MAHGAVSQMNNGAANMRGRKQRQDLRASCSEREAADALSTSESCRWTSWHRRTSCISSQGAGRLSAVRQRVRALRQARARART
jgi:hypothetical protein